MPAREPREIHALFLEATNAGDLDGLMALYEDDCALVAEPGSVIAGREQVRAGLEWLLSLKGQATLTTRDIVQVGDLALLSCAWTLDGVGPDDKPVRLGGVTAEVARRQPDGSWLYVIDNAVADQTIKA